MAKKKTHKRSNAHAKHEAKHEQKGPEKYEQQFRTGKNRTGENDAIIKTIFIILGIGLLVAAYYIGFLVGSSGGATGGSDDNTVTVGADQVLITEYSDFQCPYCQRFYTETLGKIRETYGDKVVIEYKHLPLSMHPYAQKAAEASECARDQGKFWEYHDTLFETKELDVDSLKQHAADLGLDTTKFNDCLDSSAKKEEVAEDIQEATSRGARGTPSFWLNGELVVGAQPFEVFKQKIDAALAGEAPAAPTQPQKPAAPTKVEGDISDDDAVKGDPNAPVTIVEFSDYECPFCGRHTSQTAPLIDKNFVDTGKVKIVFRDFPLSFHPHAQKAAEAAECAGEQDKYWEMHDKLYANQDSLSVDNYKKWAGEIGLDQTKFDNCLDSGAMASEIQKDFNDGRTYGVSGTPAFFINGVLLSGAQPYQAFESAINAALEK